MTAILTRYFNTPHGELLLGSFNNELCLADWRYRRMRDAVDTRIKRGLNAEYVEGTSPVIEETIEQLNSYFAGERKTFDIPREF